MILRKEHRILIYGMTGRQGTFWTKAMIDYGVSVAGGVNPKRPGQMHLGRPVFESARSARKEIEFDAVLLFVPPFAAKGSAIDAFESGARAAVILTEHVPVQDTMEILAAARAFDARVVGPNTAGLVTPGASFAGIMPAFNPSIFKPGTIGVVSRSGSLGTLACLSIVRSDFGQSAFIGVGGDPVIGTTIREALEIFESDERTAAVAICGEIGGGGEEEAAEFASSMTKPVVAFVAGMSAPQGKKMGHAGAIASGASGSYEMKRCVLEAAGVHVANLPRDIPALLADRLGAA